jgi:hypothetical protein
MLNVITILAILALLIVIASATGRAPLWVGVLLLCVIELLRVLPSP